MYTVSMSVSPYLPTASRCDRQRSELRSGSCGGCFCKSIEQHAGGPTRPVPTWTY